MADQSGIDIVAQPEGFVSQEEYERTQVKVAMSWTDDVRDAFHTLGKWLQSQDVFVELKFRKGTGENSTNIGSLGADHGYHRQSLSQLLHGYWCRLRRHRRATAMFPCRWHNG